MSYNNPFTAETQLKLSPFFERTSKLNESQEWRRWSGYLSATQYELTHDNEYFAIRTKAALWILHLYTNTLLKVLMPNDFWIDW